MIPKFTIRSLLVLTALAGLLFAALRGVQSWRGQLHRQELNQIRLDDSRGALEGRSFMINHRQVAHVPQNLTAEEFFDDRANRDVAPEFGEIHFSPLGMFVENLTSGGREAGFIFVRANDGDAMSFETPFGRAAMVHWVMEGIKFSKGTYPTVRQSKARRRAYDAIHLQLVEDTTVTVQIATAWLGESDMSINSYLVWMGRFDPFERSGRMIVRTEVETTLIPQYYDAGSMEIKGDGTYWVAIDAVQPQRDPTDVFDLIPKCFEIQTINGIRTLRILGE